jgi:hypothetical protein
VKLKDIKATEWAIGLGVAAITYFVVKKFFSLSSLSKEDLKPVGDAKSEKMIQELHPKFRNIARAFINRVKKELGLTVFLTSGYRTFKKQQELYNQNKQNAKPGYSSHNYGFAMDVNVKDKSGKIILKMNTPDDVWKKSGVLDVAKKLGLRWGGGGAFGSYNDRVHFFINPNGKTTTNLRALHNAGKVDKNGYVIV